MSKVSRAIFCWRSGERNFRVRMLCRRSASLMSTTRMSSIMARTILRTFSACASSEEANSIRLILVTPSTMCATCSPNWVLMSSTVPFVSSTTVQQAGGDGRGVELHLGQDGGHLQRVRQKRLAGFARAAFVMFEREVVGLFDEREVVLRAVGTD